MPLRSAHCLYTCNLWLVACNDLCTWFVEACDGVMSGTCSMCLYSDSQCYILLELEGECGYLELIEGRGGEGSGGGRQGRQEGEEMGDRREEGDRGGMDGKKE